MDEFRCTQLKRKKTAFVISDSLYEFNVMSFRLCDVRATFEIFMDTILQGFKLQICMCYLYYVVIFGHTFQEHYTRLDIVHGCMEKAELVSNSKIVLSLRAKL